MPKRSEGYSRELPWHLQPGQVCASEQLEWGIEFICFFNKRLDNE